MVALAVLAAVTAVYAQDEPAAAPPADAANKRCLECHGREYIATLPPIERGVMVAPGTAVPGGDPAAVRPGLYIGADPLLYGVHAGLRCVDCHQDAVTLPHPATLQPAGCGTCHERQSEDYQRSSHAAALIAGVPDAPTCASCHGTHRILPSSERDSMTHPFQAVHVCGDCHLEHTAAQPEGPNHAERVNWYLDSVHGRGIHAGGLLFAATCADCHRYHDVLPTGDPESATHRRGIPDTCGRCHLGVEETYLTSIHGMKLAEGDPDAPVCTDCHTGHRIKHAWTPQGLVDIVAECGGCHDRPEMSQGRRATFYRTYRASYHGQVTNIGGTRAARCSDCHGAHDILPIADERSRLHGDNLIETCRRCHPGAPPRFAKFDPHADYLDRARYPVLHAVWWYFIIVMSAAFGFFGMHSLLWFIRSLLERHRNGPVPRFVANPHAIRRFTHLNRFNHALLIVSFFGLTVTGLPLLLSDRPWAIEVSRLLGGGDIVGVLHRIFAVTLMLNFVIHAIGIARKVRARPEGMRRRDFFLGPNSMLPRWRDVTDCAAMLRWFVRGGRKPSFDRYTYWEKFDYLAEIFGTVVIGGSGLLLWFPIFFSRFLPGSVFNVAMIIHGYEALLAVGFIFTIHFFNAHLRAEKFPVDDVIFTGRVPEEEYKHERGDEYRRLEETGRLEALRVPPAPPWQRKFAIGVGLFAMATGFTLVALIIIAGFAALA